MASRPVTRSRLGRDARRDALLEAAVAIAAEGSVDEVTMEAVAERAGVSRPLLYKHFANRDELVAAVYRQEAENLHRRLARRVGEATTLEEMFDALITGALEAASDRGSLFSALRSAGGWTKDVRREQRTRDTATARAFTAVAKEEGVDRQRAGPAVSMLLSLVDATVVQFRARPGPERAELLRDTYMTVVRSTIAALKE